MTTHTPAQLTLVWGSDPPRRIETITVRRRYLAEAGRRRPRVEEMDVSLPRVRFLEGPDPRDSAPPAPLADDASNVAISINGEAPRLAA